MYKVLLIDDEPWALLGIEKKFQWEKKNFEVVAKTTDSLEAFDLIMKFDPDVVFTDIMMDGMSGIELLKKARKHGVDSEFVVISGYDNFSYAQEAIKYDACYYMLKPIDPMEADDLLDKLHNRLKSKTADFAHKLLGYITDASIYRLKEWRKYTGSPAIQDSFFFADDSILLLSCDMYREFVLPHHKKLCSELANNKNGNAIHLCGDATRHFKTIRDELNVKIFDTGFPVRHGKLVEELGPDVTIQGGPHVEVLRSASEGEIHSEVNRIIDEVKGHTKKFILRDGNNVAPYTPIKNIKAMYNACKKYGRYK